MYFIVGLIHAKKRTRKPCSSVDLIFFACFENKNVFGVSGQQEQKVHYFPKYLFLRNIHIFLYAESYRSRIAKERTVERATPLGVLHHLCTVPV
jgi:hypothetical protein